MLHSLIAMLNALPATGSAPAKNLNPCTYKNHGVDRNIAGRSIFDPNIRNATIEEQASHADAICKRYAGDQEFAEEQLPHSKLPFQFARWNATSLANMAYMALHAHESVRADYMEYYRIMKEALEEQCTAETE